MRALSITFQAAAIGLTLGIMSIVGHKAASDYCAITPAPSPFDHSAHAYNKAKGHQNFCNTVKTLEPYNFPYFPAPEGHSK